MSVPDSILQLVDNFETHRRAYLSQDYNEAQVRLEFINPFFEALGWDMFNKQNYASAYKDVIHEDALHTGGTSTAPDYAFRIGGTRKFFVEAKKPAVNLKDAISPAYQLRRYAWSAKLPLSILTDFEEFTVYDCRLKPTLSDKPSTGRIQLLTYRDYPTHWDEIDSIFSRQAVLKGSFDQYAESVTGKHGTTEVDHAFLAEIERWRDLLAHNIALRNPSLSQRDLNYAVQMTIDRLIFLRICEDRGIEFYGQLQALLNGGDVYPRLCQLFRNADDRYNSGLFHFRPEKGQADSPDALTMGLALDDKPLKDILANLYYPESPYEFSVLPADILGQVYEQFLGKVIRLTSAHHAVVEDKPEVKKAGGVYYTPTFIVDYIVKHTLGDLLQNKHPGEVGLGKGSPIRVLDMACGSGSFLLGAYQYLLDWYLSTYTASEPEKWASGRSPQLVQVGHGEWRLTTAERKRILLDHIYGVDIDPQAVEVTKLSLLLKVLEGENQDTVGKQLTLFHQRALPDLGQNIKCGNSLIDPDFYSSQQSTFFDPEEQYRINAFDWHKEFPQVFDKPARTLWLVTFVTHNSRVSERMVTYGVKSGDPLILNASERLLTAQYISECCHTHHIPVVAWNVLPDHVHMILAAEDERELDEQVRKIKGFSSFSFQRASGLDVGGHVWAQKYHHLLITDQRMLENAYSYVMDNHVKHADQWGQEIIDSFATHLTSPSSAPTRGLSPLLPPSSDSPLLPPSSDSPLLPPSSDSHLLSQPPPLVQSPSLMDVRDELCITPEIACQPSPGGFDVIIGNPPYGATIQSTEIDYFRSKFSGESKKYDSFELFLVQSSNLLSSDGTLGEIIPASWMTGDKYLETRKRLISSLTPIVAYAMPFDVFPAAYIDTAIIIFSARTIIDHTLIHYFPKKEKLTSIPDNVGSKVPVFVLRDDEKYRLSVLLSKENLPIIKKLKSSHKILGDWFNIQRGVQPYSRSKHTEKQISSKFLHANKCLSNEYLPELQGNELSRYYASPNRVSYIKYCNEIASSRPIKIFQGERLVVRRLLTRKFRLQASKAIETMITTDNVLNMVPIDKQSKITYSLGILNSKLISWLYVNTSMIAQKDDFPQVHISALKSIPLPNFNNTQHEKMVSLVEHMLNLHQQLANAKTPTEKTLLQRQIDTTDTQIDALVYELYGLTEKEIKMVEEG